MFLEAGDAAKTAHNLRLFVHAEQVFAFNSQYSESLKKPKEKQDYEICTQNEAVFTKGMRCCIG
ncbi:hypothetical protein ACGYK3_17115 [Sulfitobacter sp. 1A05707]|jgi:hypothetical protein|uniref:hypothetical protein n=1 Tax=Sulfitobacter sp. 1A05707 TaxID=3368560 RepID=UPI0037462C87|tara:strand:- start:262 stop:453 length:192 start_codon:yes stop_codon:yes gene_type:complete